MSFLALNIIWFGFMCAASAAIFYCLRAGVLKDERIAEFYTGDKAE